MAAHRPPPGFPAAVYALVTDRSRHVLIVQPPGTGEAAWRLPGGLVEPAETPREALRRELAEELGLDRQADTLLAVEWVLPPPPAGGHGSPSCSPPSPSPPQRPPG
ncbi:NUDIX domain-containing protein [Streptomyces albus]|uniref:NUDIX domain-containing protein n=1 Tax=Streptomyces albus TaxID=1888 RepID=UPI000A955999|nr:NUDIX domain-containing protein [Streptomyces albus]